MNFITEIIRHYKDFGIIEFLIVSFISFLMYLVYKRTSDTSWQNSLSNLSIKSSEMRGDVADILKKLEEVSYELKEVQNNINNLTDTADASQKDTLVSSKETHEKLIDIAHHLELFHNDLKTLIELLKMFKKDGVL